MLNIKITPYIFLKLIKLYNSFPSPIVFSVDSNKKPEGSTNPAYIYAET